MDLSADTIVIRTKGGTRVLVNPRRIHPTGRLVIGLCTVGTRKKSYLLQTIRSLLRNRSGRSDIVIAVYHCDLTGSANESVEALKREFGHEIDVGGLKVFRVDNHPDHIGRSDAYSSYDSWRSKQNFDCSEAFRRSQDLGDYYTHVEDDVVACPYYDLYIFKEMLIHPGWGILRMAQGGSIGCTFRQDDLAPMSAILLELLRQKPCDWIIDEYVTRYNKTVVRPGYSIFQHIGYERSLTGKTQTVVFDNFIG